LAAALNATVPLPVPLEPELMVSHEPLLLAVHAHPLVAVIVTDPVPPADVNDWLFAESAYEHESPACVTVYVPPAMVIVPVRVDCVGFAAMLNVTVTDPLALAPFVIVSQDALLEDVHVQPAGLVTLTLPLPAVAAAVMLPADNAVVHGGETWNWFEARLVADPPGPAAATRASYMTPAVSGEIMDKKFTLIFPSLCGEGFPRLTLVNGEDCPTTYRDI
jgi:hypothetical protein